MYVCAYVLICICIYSRHDSPSAKINHTSIANPNERSVMRTFSRLKILLVSVSSCTPRQRLSLTLSLSLVRYSVSRHSSHYVWHKFCIRVANKRHSCFTSLPHPSPYFAAPSIREIRSKSVTRIPCGFSINSRGRKY